MKPIVPATVLLAASLSASVAAQDTPSHLQDLVGARAAGGETQLESRGYEFIKSQKGTDRIWANWWNPSNQQCLSVVTFDGRYDSIVVAPKLDCDQGGGSSGSSSGGGVQSVVGMRASSGESELQNMGYQFANSSKGDDRIWANWWNASSKKCITVVTLDGRYDSVVDTLPADCDKSAGGHPHDFNDLVGARGSSVDARMEQDGFRNVDAFKGGDVAKTWWFSPKTAECVVIDVVDGKVDKVGRAPGYPACKN